MHPKSLTFLATFEHNALSWVMLIVFGIISFGIGNSILVAYNGLILGLTLIGVYNTNGLTPIITGIGPQLFLSLTLSRKVDIYLMDEPFNTLDVMSRKVLVEYIESNKELTYLIVSHLKQEGLNFSRTFNMKN